MMRARAAWPLVVAGLLTGCVSDKVGADYAAIAQKVGPPKPGQSRIVVLSEKATGLGYDGAICNLKVDDVATPVVKPGSYVYIDRPAGRHEMLATQSLFPGDTKREVTTAAGRTYFFVIKNSARANTLTGAAIAGGLVGAAVASVATSGEANQGPVDLFPLDESAARAALTGLQLSE